MSKIFKNLFNNRIKYHDTVILSSFLFLLSAVLINKQDPFTITFLFIIFITSIFYHSHPNNVFFRVADWLITIAFIFYLFNIIYTSENFLNSTFSLVTFFMAIFSVLIWIVSFIASFFGNGYTARSLYNFSHTLWHFSACLVVILIIFGR